ncbi:MAG: hypothetical protein HDS89_03615 [Bacteroidales bacterium]|nr:hypothetical protein [Bacteroidales bacterium]
MMWSMEKGYKFVYKIAAVVLAIAAPLTAVANESADTASSAAPDGKYIFVPDSLQKDVLKLLKGHSKVVDDESKIDASELVKWKGDTLNMQLKSRNFGRFDRGLSNYLFIPKGQWSFGLTASYGELSTDNLEMLGLLSDVDISGHMFSVKPYMSYFIKNNVSIGMRFGYTSAKGNINSFNVDIDEDMNFNLHDIMYRNESYTAAFTLRQYIGIARRGRFGVFNDVELAFSSGNSDFQRPYAGVLRNTHTTYMEAGLNFSPGVCVFIMKNVSFNLSFGVFGFYLRNEKQMENGEETGNRTTSGANFRFNIFNINFGIGVHI